PLRRSRRPRGRPPRPGSTSPRGRPDARSRRYRARCGSDRAPREGMLVHMTEPSGLRVTRSITIPANELTWRFSRSSGPGGQSVNTADSRVELRWNLLASAALPESLKTRAVHRLGTRLVDGVLSVTASEHRAQLQNRRAAQERLAALIAEAVAAPP